MLIQRTVFLLLHCRVRPSLLSLTIEREIQKNWYCSSIGNMVQCWYVGIYKLTYWQLFGTALLVGSVLAVVDKSNTGPDGTVAPVVIGLIVFVIGATFGFNCGYAINPARDLGPRFFTAIAGWGWEVFTWVHSWACAFTSPHPGSHHSTHPRLPQFPTVQDGVELGLITRQNTVACFAGWDRQI